MGHCQKDDGVKKPLRRMIVIDLKQPFNQISFSKGKVKLMSIQAKSVP